MQDEPDPPRKIYGFKPREFDRANPAPPPPPSSDAPAPGPDIPAANAGKIDVHELIRAGAGERSQFGSNAVVNRRNEVHAMLQHNLARADAAGLNDLAPKIRRRSRRRRDYWLLLIGVDGLVASSLFVFGVNLVSVVAALAAIVFFSAAITWILWVLLEDY